MSYIPHILIGAGILSVTFGMLGAAGVFDNARRLWRGEPTMRLPPPLPAAPGKRLMVGLVSAIADWMA